MTLLHTLKNCRNNKNCRLSIIGLLILIVLALLIFWGKAKVALWIILVLLLAAFGVEYFDHDVDLQKLWETWSVKEARVEHKGGMKIFGEDCSSNNLNCADFKTQSEAQKKYDFCWEKIAADNKTNKENIRNIDIYGLDRDKDGVVCESLPQALAQ